MSSRPEYLALGEVARLIPILPDSRREQITTSCLLAGMRSVLELRQALFKSIGIKVGTSAKLEAWTEVSFVGDKKNQTNDRPDGLLILKTGRREWRALVEAKVNNADVTDEQIQRYITQAKLHGIDAVITLSNQMVAMPTHHPVKLSKKPPKSVDVFHWSWNFIRTQAALLLRNDSVEDEDQVFILSELLRYLESPRSGINDFTSMNSEWKEVVNKVRSNVALNKTADEVVNTVAAWHQEQRDLCLIMSRLTGSEVTLKLKNAHRSDAALRLKDDAADFVNSNTLSCSLNVPNAAADLHISADLTRRTITASMALMAPKDKKSTKARANWLLRQLKKTKAEGFYIKATRPGKSENTQNALSVLRDAPEAIESDVSNSTATAFDVIYEVDLAGRFSGSKVFIDELEAAVPHFYEQAGQSLKAWVPPAPKVDKRKADKLSEDGLNEGAVDE